MITANNIGNIINSWFEKTIIYNKDIDFDSTEIYSMALEYFKTDYSLYYPQSREILLSNVLLRAELQGILLYRISHQYYLKENLNCDYYSLLGRYLSGFEIYYSANIGKYFKIYHGLGSVIGARVVRGEYCIIHQGVTFGDKNGMRPIIKDNVIIYAGAKILGGITVNNNAIIGANAVCINDVPENCMAVGVPAKIKTKWNYQN